MKITKKYEKIMLVDDNETDNCINRFLFEQNSFCDKVYVWHNPEHAINYFKTILMSDKSLHKWIPDLIFIDVYCAITANFRFLLEIEKINEKLLKKVKIIILTSSVNIKYKNRLLKQKYLVAYLNKPISLKALKGTLNIKSNYKCI